MSRAMKVHASIAIICREGARETGEAGREPRGGVGRETCGATRVGPAEDIYARGSSEARWTATADNKERSVAASDTTLTATDADGGAAEC